jgi:hypothetical protein
MAEMAALLYFGRKIGVNFFGAVTLVLSQPRKSFVFGTFHLI